MPAAAPAPFEDLGPLVFGDHALNLEPKIVLGGATDRVVQETTTVPARRNSSIRST